MGNSLALYNPPMRVAEEIAMLDCISGGRLVAGFPVGTPMDTCYAYGQNPSTAARALRRSARSDPAGLDEEDALHLARTLEPAALRQRLAAPVAEAPSADLDSGRRLDRDLALVRRARLRLLATSRTSATGRRQAPCAATGTEMQRLGKEPNPYRAGFLQFVGVAETREEALKLYREPAEYFYGRCLHLDPRFAHAARLHERRRRSARACGRRSRARPRARAPSGRATRRCASRRSSTRAT